MAVAAALLAALVAVTVIAAIPRDDEVPAEVDVVVALGGSPGRVSLGAQLADEHDADLVLAAGSIHYGAEQGLACERDAICLWPEPSTTAGEAHGMAELAAEHGWDTVAVATSRFHVNRSRLLFEQCFDDVAVVGAPDPQSRAAVRVVARELAGMVAGMTVARAC